MTGYFVVFAWDTPSSLGARAAANAEHFAHIETIMDKIAVAGPMKDREGQNIGSLLLFKVASYDEAEALLHADPYFKARVWERWEIHPFLPAAGEWIGGKIW
jgi:uncharacterized protein